MKHLPILILLLLQALSVHAQKGMISGTVIGPEAGQLVTMPFVNVVIKGTSIGATTDLDGRFSFEADPGDHVLQASFVGFEPAEQAVKISAGGSVNVDLQLRAQSIALKEFEVTHAVDRERETVLLMERKASTQLVQTIGAQELKRKGASHVAEGVQKVVGVGTIGGRHIVVRGLGDRYNSAYLNGLPLASPDPDMKVAPLDIFPSDVVESITVAKAYSPEFYGDMSGGAVDIRTKRTTGRSSLKIGIGSALNSQTTFKTFRSFNDRNGQWSFFNAPDGSPPGSASGPGRLNGERPPFQRNFDPIGQTASPDLNFGIFGSTRLNVARNITLDVIGTANHSTGRRYTYGRWRMLNVANTALLDYGTESWTISTRSSALGSATLGIGRRNSITATLLGVDLASDEHRLIQGDHFDQQDEVYARRFTTKRTMMLIRQLNGQHHFGIEDRLTVEWGLGLSTASSAEPDRRQLIYLRDRNTGIFRFNAIDRLENHRWYSELEEKERNARTSIRYRILQKETTEGYRNIFSLQAGAQIKRKDRDLGYDIFSYDLQGVNAAHPEGIDPDRPDSYLSDAAYQAGQLAINNVTGPEADHWIEQRIDAAFVSAEVDILQRLKLIGGMRVEQGGQRIIHRRQSDSFHAPMRVTGIDTTDVLPFGSLKFALSDRSIVRASASRTISRPGFREMAPFEYTEYFAGTRNVGNPDLKNGSNQNFDLRYERFGTGGDLIAIGVFAKRLIDPIEKVSLASSSGQLLSFRNTGSAEVAGIEFELIKEIGTILQKDSSIWNDLRAGINFTLMRSELRIGDGVGDGSGADMVLTNAVRPLQGASPYIVNFDLNYSHDLKKDRNVSATVVYSVFGPRVFAAGANGLGDQYELPVHTIDLVLGAQLGARWQADLSFRNILDATYRIEQETPNGPSVINQYRIGTGISAGVAYRIL